MIAMLCTRARQGLPAGLLAAALLLLASTVSAQVPQTIVIDGTNDFNSANLIDDDTGDTEIKDWCGADGIPEGPMDLGQIFVTNDANNIYIGFEYQRFCFSSPQVNLGIAFSYGPDADGGNTDPFNRKIAWNTIVRKPDNVFYVVIDAFNFEALYDWNGVGWDNISATVNPAYVSGSDGLGMANDLGFEELALPLSVFGLNPGDTLYLEIWMTQDGTSKPPLDAMASDAVQTSTPTGTTFDVTTAVEMTSYWPYTIQSTVDVDPPLVTGASHTIDSQIDMVFNEPVDAATAEIPGNYALSGGTSPASIVGATVDAGVASIVHLTLSNDIIASADAYKVLVTGVKDQAGNTIVNDGIGNAGCFAVKQVTFEGLFGPYLASNSTPPDTFSVEGSKAPLSFALCDGALMTDTGVGDIWNFTTDFSFPVDCASNTGSLTVEWKFAHQCTQFESIGNRSFTLDLSSPSVQTISAYWDDLDPTAFTDKDIDVIFTVDMSRQSPIGGDEIGIGGSQPPLDFIGPFPLLVDDGSGQDLVAGDQIYTTVVRFPTGTLKNVDYKFTLNAAFECFGASNRNVFLNDQVFDTIGGINGPLVMPLAYFDRCGVIGHDVEVVFSVDLRNSIYTTSKLGVQEVRLTGSVAPLVFDIPSSPMMFDDGNGFDLTAGDNIWTLSVVFGDSSNSALEYKYAVNGEFEGLGLPNRFVWLSDTFDATGNPQVLPLDDIHHTVPTGVDDSPSADRRGVSLSAYPNPFNPTTSLLFDMPRKGRARLEIFDARGRRVRILADGEFEAGPHTLRWDGRADDGRAVGSGIYYTRVLSDGTASAVKLVLIK